MADQKIYGDGFITGYGRVEGRLVFVFAQDFTVFGGSLSETNAAKIVKIMDLAAKMALPSLAERFGRRAHSGRRDVAGRLRRHFFAQHALQRSGAADLGHHGPCAGGAVYSPAITDFILMVDQTSYMFITGPDVIKTVNA